MLLHHLPKDIVVYIHSILHRDLLKRALNELKSRVSYCEPDTKRIYFGCNICTPYKRCCWTLTYIDIYYSFIDGVVYYLNELLIANRLILLKSNYCNYRTLFAHLLLIRGIKI